MTEKIINMLEICQKLKSLSFLSTWKDVKNSLKHWLNIYASLTVASLNVV